MKTITKDDRLAAFALFTMAVEHYRKCREFEAATAQRLGFKDDAFANFGLGRIADKIYEGGRVSADEFDALLADEGVTVE